MEDVRFVVDPQEAMMERDNNMLLDKINEKLGTGHVYEFSIKNNVLTIRTTKTTFSAPISDITATYVVNHTIPVYTLKAKNGKKTGFTRANTYLDDEDIAAVEEIIESLPGFKGRAKSDKFFLVLCIVAAATILLWLKL